jgi:hypothetical protein
METARQPCPSAHQPVREIEDLREQALGDAIAAETGADDPQQRIVAAELASVYRVLSPRPPGASRPASRARRSGRCSRRSPAAPLTCSSRPWAAMVPGHERTALLLFEPSSVVNPGDAGGDLTAEVEQLT